MAQVSSLKAVMVVFVLATFANMAANVSAQSTGMAPAPAPSSVTGAGFSLPVSVNNSMAHVSSLNVVMVLSVLATLAMAANYVSAQGSDMAPAPAPSMVTETGFSFGCHYRVLSCFLSPCYLESLSL
ncbi:hypothetical protein QYF36_000163 [Acer negundo]|nr:hypothetical protein QYF36_000163 [Acer negundo]